MRVPAVEAKILCDKCGKEIPITYGTSPTVITVSANNAWWRNGADSKKCEYCQQCWRAIYEELLAVLTRK